MAFSRRNSPRPTGRADHVPPPREDKRRKSTGAPNLVVESGSEGIATRTKCVCYSLPPLPIAGCREDVFPGLRPFSASPGRAVACSATLARGPYSVQLKREPVVDVMVLAGLYVLRVVAGGVITSPSTLLAQLVWDDVRSRCHRRPSWDRTIAEVEERCPNDSGERVSDLRRSLIAPAGRDVSHQSSSTKP